MKGWQDMDQATLDDAYLNADYIPGAETFPPRWQAEAAAFRATARGETDLPYGDGPRDRFDLFLPDGPHKGLMVFIHGGYWRRFGRSDWSHLARGALVRGHAVAMPGYPLVPEVRIAEITARMTRAVDAAAARVSGPICLTGHSAGGHLCGRMVMADAAPACADRIVTCVPISPVADLRPLILQTLNAEWRLDAAEAQAESAALGSPLPQPRIAVHVGAEERPAFLWQAEALAKAWSTPLRVVPNRHHFDVIDALTDPESALLADILHT